MKRRLLKVAVFLLLGAIVNVVVAWGCLFLEQPRVTGAPRYSFGITYTFGESPSVGLPLRCLRWASGGYDNYPEKLLWPGFVINTIFYAAILWMMFVIPGVLRHKWRLTRGLCPACAYPVGASPVCTECGKPLPKRAGTAS